MEVEEEEPSALTARAVGISLEAEAWAEVVAALYITSEVG